MRSIQLVLQISKHPEEYTGPKQIEMPESGGSIGRAVGCTFPLNDHNRFISGTHCLISVYGDAFYISDVSTNGTLINGNKVLKNQPITLCDGDVVMLGQYELLVVLEATNITQDIAADIAPERISNDPLSNLEEVTVSESEHQGALEELFMETKSEEVSQYDPVAHLNFSMSSDEDYLIRDMESETPKQPTKIDSTRQVSDDSFSVHSEFDLPNLIPEDWMGGESKIPQKNSAHSQKISNIKQPDLPLTQVQQPSQNQQAETSLVREAVGQRWEEVTQPFTPSSQQTPNSEDTPTPKVDVVIPEIPVSQTVEPNSDLSRAFYEGLGINDPKLIRNEAKLFKQMGTCLRLCIDNLQKDLKQAEEMKGEQNLDESALNLIELMLTLNSQNLLSPNELIEQMLDELNDHQIFMNRAINDVIVEHSKVNDPSSFALTHEQKSLFSTKSRLWGDYVEFYRNNRRQLNENSLNAMIKQNYTKATKGNHA